MHCLTYCLTQPEHAVYLANTCTHNFFNTHCFVLHCLPCALLLAAILPVPPPTSVCARAHAMFIHVPITRDRSIINSFDCYATNERQLYEEQLHEEQLHEETVLSKSLCRLLNKASHLTAFYALYSSLHLPVTPAQLMRPGIGRNASCAVGDFA